MNRMLPNRSKTPRRAGDPRARFTGWRAAAPLLLCGACLVAGCDGGSPASSLQSAKAHLEKNENKAAIIELKGALQKDANSGEARFLLGKALLEEGDARLALVELTKAHQLRYSADAVEPLLAAAHNAQGQFAETVARFGQTQLAKPTAQSALQLEVAKAHAQLGDQAKADAALAAALAATPDDPLAHVLKGHFAATAGRLDDALSIAEALLARNPASAEAWNLKGDVLYNARRELVVAADAYRNAVKLKPQFWAAWSNLLAVLIQARDFAGAEAELARVKKIRPGVFLTRYYEALLAFERQDFDTARRLSENLLVQAPDEAKALHLGAAVKLQAGAYGEAERLANKALRSAPGNPSALRLLGQVHLRSGQAGKALDLLLPLVDHGTERSDLVALVAHAYLLDGDAQRAESYFMRAAQSGPQDVTNGVALAMARMAMGKADEGMAELRALAKRDSGITADLALINALSRRQQYDAALAAVAELARKDEKSPLASVLKGRIENARGDRKGARASFEQALAVAPRYFPATAALASLDLDDGKPDAAKQRLDRVLAEEPRNQPALLAMAEVRLRSGAALGEVDALLTRAVEADPTAAAPRLRLIDRALKARNHKRAVTIAEEGLAAQPNNAALLEALGRARMAAGDFNQALVPFNRLIELFPKAVPPQLALAEVYAAMKRPDSAVQSIKKALAIAPDSVAAQRALFSIYVSTGQKKQARSFAQTLQSQRPQDSIGYLFEGEIDAKANDWNAAAASFQRGLARNKSTGLAVKLHTALVKGGKRKDAERMAAAWTAEFPKDDVFVYYLADDALTSKDYVAAEKHYRSFVEMRPESPIALNNLAWLTWKLDKPGALELAERANKLAPNQAALLDTWAMLLAEDNRLKEAIELQSQAVRLKPQESELHLKLAKMLIKAGDKARARDELQTMIRQGASSGVRAEADTLLKSL